MTLTQLEYVIAVATYRSFIAAAEKTFVTQPTLSMQINKLEEELNIKIFDRNHHPISVTAIGEDLVAQAKIVVSEAARIHELVNHAQDHVSGTLRIAIIPTLSPYIVPSLLQHYSDKYPEVRLVVNEYQTQEIIEKLKKDELDCGIMSTPLDDKRLQEHPLFLEPLVGYFAVGEEPLKKRTIEVEDIDLAKIWMLNEGNCLRNQIINLCSDHVQELQDYRPYRYESGNIDTLRKMVDSNGGLTIIPELATLGFTEDQQDQIRYFVDPQPVREISIVTNKHFVKTSLLQSVMDEILALVPEPMRVQKANRRVLRIQSSKM